MNEYNGYGKPDESTIMRSDSIKASSLLQLADAFSQNILLHPFIALRRTCQVNRRCSPFICVQPFSLLPFLYRQQRKQGIASLYRGLSSVLLVKGITLGTETAIINYTDWPREVSQKRLFKDFWRVLALRGLSVAISTPFLCAAVKETIQSVIEVRDRPSFVDCINAGFFRLLQLSSVSSARMLPIGLLIVPTIVYHVSYSAIWHATKNCLEAVKNSSIFGRKSKARGAIKHRTRIERSMLENSSWQQEEMTYEATETSFDVDKIELDNDQISNSIIASLIAEVTLLPMETVLNCLYIQGTRTIIDNVDETTVLLPVLTNFDGFNDCYQSILKLEGNMGLYKGLGAIILQYSAHYFLLRSLYFLLREFKSNNRTSTTKRSKSPLKVPTHQYKRSLENNRHSTPSNPYEPKPHLDSMIIQDTMLINDRETNFDFMNNQFDLTPRDN